MPAEKRAPRRRVPYLVSGDENIYPAHTNLKRSGRPVRHDTQVADNAADTIKTGRRFVVIAHGNAAGTISWFNSDRGTTAPWLWVGMPDPPSGGRVYLYACSAGERLRRFLTKCECFGHSTPVPMPTGGTEDVVLRYLDEVDRLMLQSEMDYATWRERLGRFVNREYAVEVLNRTGALNAAAWALLRESLGYVDS